MGATPIDPAEFREGQRKQWNVAAGGWRRWSELLDRALDPIGDRLVELAAVDSGAHVIDIAAGYGEPTLTAARRAGPEGRVVATDISAEMLAYGRERAAAANLSNVEFVESDAMSLDFPAGSFDAALSRFGIIFDPAAEDAAARVRGFMKPGARMAIASWGPPDRVPFLSLPMRTAIAHLGIEPPPPGMPGPLSRPTPEAIAGLLEGGGFGSVEVEQTEVALEFDSAGDFTTFVREIAPPISSLFAPHPPDVREAGWAAITDAAAAIAEPDGRVATSNLVLMAVGTA